MKDPIERLERKITVLLVLVMACWGWSIALAFWKCGDVWGRGGCACKHSPVREGR